MTWNQELAQSLSSLDALKEAGLLTPPELERLQLLGPTQIRVTTHYTSLIDRNDPHCPIRLQAIPGLGEADPELPAWAQEWSKQAYGRPTPWSADAIGDVAKLAVPRLTHRYGNRALLHTSPACAVYCRFCFRKSHLDAREEALYSGRFDEAIQYLTAHSEIRELVLTGGDPLSLTDNALESLLLRLAEEVPHLRTVRLHSRMAVTLPSRLTAELGSLLSRPYPFTVALVSHFNHIREWTQASQQGLQRMRRSVIALYNQSVLLRGVNDSTNALGTLFQSLYEGGVTPFYLHHADWTPGTFHFRVPLARGIALADSLQGRISGPAVPRFMVDLPGGHGKTEAYRFKALETRTEGRLTGALYETPTGRLYCDLAFTRV